MYPSLYLERLNKAKLPELRQICKDLGLKSGGLKSDVIDRIYRSFKCNYDNYHSLIPRQSHFDIGTAIITEVRNETLSFGDEKKTYYLLRVKISTHYNQKTEEYRSEYWLNIHFGKNLKGAESMLQKIVAGVTSDTNNIYIREKYSLRAYNSSFIDIIPIEKDRIILSVDASNIDLKEYPIGYIEDSIKQGYNNYLDVLPKE